MRNLAEYIHYFRTLATFQPAIRDFVFGDSERIINQQRTDLNYPVLWLESPDIRESEDGIHFEGAFVILINTPRDDYQNEDVVQNHAFAIAQSVIARMRYDQATGLFEMLPNVQMDNISTLTHNNDHGWRVTVSLTHQAYLCPPSYITNDLFTGAVAAFTWENYHDPEGNAFEIILKHKSIPLTGWNNYSWEYKVDGGLLQNHNFTADPPDLIIAEGSSVEVILTIELVNLYKLVARATIPAATGNGISYPDPIIITGDL